MMLRVLKSHIDMHISSGALQWIRVLLCEVARTVTCFPVVLIGSGRNETKLTWMFFAMFFRTREVATAFSAGRISPHLESITTMSMSLDGRYRPAVATFQLQSSQSACLAACQGCLPTEAVSHPVLQELSPHLLATMLETGDAVLVQGRKRHGGLSCM